MKKKSYGRWVVYRQRQLSSKGDILLQLNLSSLEEQRNTIHLKTPHRHRHEKVAINSAHEQGPKQNFLTLSNISQKPATGKYSFLPYTGN